MESHMSWKSRKVTPTLAVLAFASASLCALCPISNGLILRPILANFDSRYVSGAVTPMPFDQGQWRSRKARHRVAMALTLADEKRLDGKTRAELVEMLGEPDIERTGDEGIRWLLGYYAKGLFDETLWLELTIGENGTASGAVVANDWYDPRQR
jgi:hypothetical protein